MKSSWKQYSVLPGFGPSFAATVVCAGRTAPARFPFTGIFRTCRLFTLRLRSLLASMISWGVTPYLSEEYNSLDVVFYQALNAARSVYGLKKGDNVVMTGGQIGGAVGNTNIIKVESVESQSG